MSATRMLGAVMAAVVMTGSGLLAAEPAAGNAAGWLKPQAGLAYELFGSNMGDSNTHDNTNLPILLAGRSFRHGQQLAFRHDNNTPLCNLFVTMLHCMELKSDVFGSSTGTMNEINA